MLLFTQCFKGYPGSLLYVTIFQFNFSVWVNIPWRDEKILSPLPHLIYTTVSSMSFENLLRLRSFWHHYWYSADSSFPFRHLTTVNFENVLLIRVLTLETSLWYVFCCHHLPYFLFICKRSRFSQMFSEIAIHSLGLWYSLTM